MSKPSTKRIEIETEAETPAQAPAPDNPDVVIVKTADAAKLSPRGEGGITYQVGRIGDDVYVRIEKNAGGGSHSREFIRTSAVKAAITPEMERGAAFKSDALTAAFVGKSQCNSGFLVAALRAEGIFSVDAERKGMSVLTGDLDAWERRMRESEPLLGDDGQPVTAKLHPEPKETKFRPKQAAAPSDDAPPEEAPPDGEDKPRRLVRIRRSVAKRLGVADDSESAPADGGESAEPGDALEIDSE